MSEHTPRPPDTPVVPDRSGGAIDFSQFSTEQLLELRAAFDASRLPLERAAVEHELARRGLLSDESAPPLLLRFEVRFTRRDGIVGWLEAKSARGPLFGAGTVELHADTAVLSGWSRTWLGVRQAAQVSYALSGIANVATDQDLVRLTTSDGGRRHTVSFRAADAERALALAARLPSTKDAGFEESWSQLTAFNRDFLASTPHAYATTALVTANLAMYLGLFALSLSPFQLYAGQFQGWAANAGILTLNGEWWRLATSLFLHANFPHVALNMWALWNLGRLCERLYGRATFVILYVLCGVSASMWSILWDANRYSIGASGAIFGLLGALLAFLTLSRPRVPAQIARAHRWGTVVFIVLNLVAGALNYGVDNAAHVGGLLAGLVLGAILAAAARQDRVGRISLPRAVAAIALTAALLLAGEWAARGGGTGTPESYQWLQAHRWYSSGEAASLKGWAELDQAIASGTVSRQSAADQFAREVLPFWNAAQQRLELEKRTGAPSRLSVALADFVSARLAWARVWVEVLKGADESTTRELERDMRATLLAQARFSYRSIHQTLDDRPHSWADAAIVSRLRELLPFTRPACVADRNALSRSSGSGDSPTDGPAQRVAAGCATQALLRSGAYAALDAKLKHDAAHLGDLDDGSSSFSGDVAGLSDYFDYSGVDPPHLLARLSNWRRAVPASVYPDLSDAMFYEAAAWQIRGRGYADSVSNQQWQLFAQQLEMAAAALDGAGPRGKLTPLWYSLTLEIGLDRSVGSDSLRSTFDSGAERFPGDERLYRDMLRALMPRWGGSFGEVDKFIQATAKNEWHWSPDERYAYLYLQYADLEGDETDIFADVGADWPRLLVGFDALVRAFPRSDLLLNAYARFACRAGDADSYRTLRPRLDGRRADRVWKPTYSVDACDKKLGAGASTVASGRAPRPAAARLDDSDSGRPPELHPAVATFWDVRLGETRLAVERAKGLPLKVRNHTAIYNAAAPGADAIVEVEYAKTPEQSAEHVRAIFYRGGRDHAPPGLPFIDGITGEQLTEKFGAPVWSGVPNADSEYQMFADGLTADLWHRTVARYGIQDFYRTQ